MKSDFSAPMPVRGFTFLELMISMAIMLIMSVILFARYPETVKRLTLANATHVGALVVQEAQVRGSAIDSINSSLGGYGTYVTLTRPDRIVLFGDSVTSTLSPYQIYVGDGLYQSTPVDEAKTTTMLPVGYAVAKLCVGTGFPFTCNASNVPAINSLTISFTRPSPLPNIYVNNATSTAVFTASCIEFRSVLAPLVGHIRSVQIFSSGIIRTISTGCE